MGCLWDARGMSMGRPWAVRVLAIVDYWLIFFGVGLLVACCGMSMGCPWAAHVMPTACPWAAGGTVSNRRPIEKTYFEVYCRSPVGVLKMRQKSPRN